MLCSSDFSRNQRAVLSLVTNAGCLPELGVPEVIEITEL